MGIKRLATAFIGLAYLSTCHAVGFCEIERRLELAHFYVTGNAGGLSEGVPPYYLKTLSAKQRIKISEINLFDENILAHCMGLARTIDFAYPESLPEHLRFPMEWTNNQRILLHYEPKEADSDCYLSAQNKRHLITAVLVKFHNKEQELQDKARAILRELDQLSQGESIDASSLETQVHALYKNYCPENPNAFHPKLCENGENVLIDAIREVEAKMDSASSPDSSGAK